MKLVEVTSLQVSVLTIRVFLTYLTYLIRSIRVHLLSVIETSAHMLRAIR